MTSVIRRADSNLPARRIARGRRHHCMIANTRVSKPEISGRSLSRGGLRRAFDRREKTLMQSPYSHRNSGPGGSQERDHRNQKPAYARKVRGRRRHSKTGLNGLTERSRHLSRRVDGIISLPSDDIVNDGE